MVKKKAASHRARLETYNRRMSRKSGGRQSRSMATGQILISVRRLWIPAAPVTRAMSAKNPGQLK